MPKPADIPTFIRALHASYESRTGYSIRYNMHRERQWLDWCEWAGWDWTERDLAIVIGYLRSKISKGDRNEGALKFENLIGSPDRFEEDLNLANEARKGAPAWRPKTTAPAPAKSAGLTNSMGEAVEGGKDAAIRFSELLKQDTP